MVFLQGFSDHFPSTNLFISSWWEQGSEHPATSSGLGSSPVLSTFFLQINRTRPEVTGGRQQVTTQVKVTRKSAKKKSLKKKMQRRDTWREGVKPAVVSIQSQNLQEHLQFVRGVRGNDGENSTSSEAQHVMKKKKATHGAISQYHTLMWVSTQRKGTAP